MTCFCAGLDRSRRSFSQSSIGVLCRRSAHTHSPVASCCIKHLRFKKTLPRPSQKGRSRPSQRRKTGLLAQARGAHRELLFCRSESPPAVQLSWASHGRTTVMLRNIPNNYTRPGTGGMHHHLPQNVTSRRKPGRYRSGGAGPASVASKA